MTKDLFRYFKYIEPLLLDADNKLEDFMKENDQFKTFGCGTIIAAVKNAPHTNGYH
jgi:hypothetical protein